MRVVGIDWATAAKDRALVAVEIADGFDACRVKSVANIVDHAETVAVCTNAQNSVVAVDIPFAWPLEFARFVSSWRPAGGASPPASDEFRFRMTDRIVRDTGQNPLPVSADRIAMGARAWAEIVAGNDLGSRIDVDGTLHANPPTLIEVYPGATARALGQHRYKKNAAARRKLVSHAAKVFAVDFDGQLDAIVGKGEDSNATDAFLAAVTAAIYLGDCRGAELAGAGWSVRRPRASETAAAAAEGWIFFRRRRPKARSATTSSEECERSLLAGI